VKETIQKLTRYVEDVVGAPPRFTPAPEQLQVLPTYFSTLYEACCADILDHKYLLLLFRGRETPTPTEIAAHNRIATRRSDDRVVFVFDRLDSFFRQRLIRYRVPFIVPRRQMYLPQFIADFRERVETSTKQIDDSAKRLSGPSQVLLLYYLQQKKIRQALSLRDWTKLLGYSAMTVTRTANELLQAELCTVSQVGRKMLLSLDGDRHALWKKALPLLGSPVRGRRFVHLMGKDTPQWPKAGLTALSSFTMLAADNHTVVAMSSAEYARALIEERFRELPFADDNAITVERWRYRPELLSGTQADTVDRLSLYLSLRDDHDERIQAALEELLEGLQW
jgi:DNA-binding MarR family transcriptional regulator